MEQMKLNSFLFYKAVFFLTMKQRLTWTFNGRVLSSQVTNELMIKLTFYDNGAKPYVGDFECIYSYYDIAHQLVKESLFERFRESNDDHKLYAFKSLFDIAKEQSLKSINEKGIIEPYELLNEYLGIYQFQYNYPDKNSTAFNENLLIKVLRKAID